jgi:hypothetical protein
MIPQAKEIEALATKYSKPQLQQMAQMGQIDPQTAVMAGMMIDRIVQSNIQPPQSTVAQDVMGAGAPQGMAQLPANGMAPPPMDPSMMAPPPMDPSMMAPPAMGEPMLAASGGLLQLPVPDTMFNEDSFAGGGIVAFAPGGSTFDAFEPSEAVYDEFSSYQPLFPMLGSGNRKYALKQLGYSNAQVDAMTPSQQEFVLQSVGKPQATTSAAPAAAPSGTVPPAPTGSAPKTGAPRSPVAAPTAAPATPAAPAKSPYDLFQERLNAAGLSGDLEAEDRAANAAALEALAKDREQAKYMAILQAGLGMMGGTSANALENIAKGITPAVGEYAKSTRELKADEREINKINRDLRKAAEARKRGDIEKALELEQGARDFELRQKVADAQIRSSNKPTLFEEFRRNPKEFAAFRAAYGGEKSGARQIKDTLETINETLLNLPSKDPRRAALEQNRDALLRRLMGEVSGGGAGGKTLSWDDIK